VQGWTIAWAARKLHVALPRTERALRRVELDLPGQLEQELVGYLVRKNSLFLKRRVIPSWSKPTLIIRDEQIFTPSEAEPVVAGDYVYLLAPPEKADALDRFFTDMPAVLPVDPHMLGDFMVLGEITLGNLSGVYGVPVSLDQIELTLADYFDINLDHVPKIDDTLPFGDIVLVVRSISGGRVSVVGLRLPEEEEQPAPPLKRRERAKRKARQMWKQFVESL
jgi:cell volume regulation protein A